MKWHSFEGSFKKNNIEYKTLHFIYFKGRVKYLFNGIVVKDNSSDLAVLKEIALSFEGEIENN